MCVWIEVKRICCARCDKLGKMEGLEKLEKLGEDRKRLMMEIEAGREWEGVIGIQADEAEEEGLLSFLEEDECEDEEVEGKEEGVHYDGGGYQAYIDEEDEDEEGEEWADVDDEEEDYER